MEIIEKEKPEGVIVQYGGQTPLKLSRALAARRRARSSAPRPTASTSPRTASASRSWSRALKLKQPANATARTEEQAVIMAREVGFPLVVRPSYVLGGRAMEVVFNEDDLRAVHDRRGEGVERQPGAARSLPRPRHRGGRGCGVRRRGRADRRHHGAHRAGRRALRRLRLLAAAERPVARRSQDELRAQTRKLAKALNVVGLMNIQFAIQSGVIYILEVNPRASRTVPFVSKATGIPLAKVAARVMTGKSLEAQGADRGAHPALFLGQGGGVSRSSSSRRPIRSWGRR